MISETPTLYHGSTVGWLHLSGFDHASFAFGEASDPHPFVFLCTSREGAESAACKAYSKVLARSDGKLPIEHYRYGDQPFLPERYVYRVRIAAQADVLDLAAGKLEKGDLARVRKAISLSKGSLVSRGLALVKAWVDLRVEPEMWQIRLTQAFEGRRNEMVRTLAQVGFDLIRNLEGDGDGQGYDEVWALPLCRVSCVSVLEPEIFKIKHR